MLVAIRPEKEWEKALFVYSERLQQVVGATCQAEAQKGFCKLKAMSK
jgi:hypothetical protein